MVDDAVSGGKPEVWKPRPVALQSSTAAVAAGRCKVVPRSVLVELRLGHVALLVDAERVGGAGRDARARRVDLGRGGDDGASGSSERTACQAAEEDGEGLAQEA